MKYNVKTKIAIFLFFALISSHIQSMEQTIEQSKSGTCYLAYVPTEILDHIAEYLDDYPHYETDEQFIERLRTLTQGDKYNSISAKGYEITSDWGGDLALKIPGPLRSHKISLIKGKSRGVFFNTIIFGFKGSTQKGVDFFAPSANFYLNPLSSKIAALAFSYSAKKKSLLSVSASIEGFWLVDCKTKKKQFFLFSETLNFDENCNDIDAIRLIAVASDGKKVALTTKDLLYLFDLEDKSYKVIKKVVDIEKLLRKRVLPIEAIDFNLQGTKVGVRYTYIQTEDENPEIITIAPEPKITFADYCKSRCICKDISHSR